MRSCATCIDIRKSVYRDDQVDECANAPTVDICIAMYRDDQKIESVFRITCIDTYTSVYMYRDAQASEDVSVSSL